jgi:hypothetical protein
VDLLTGDIEREEERAEVRDVSDPTYPVLARNLRERREVEPTAAHLRAAGWAKFSKSALCL